MSETGTLYGDGRAVHNKLLDALAVPMLARLAFAVALADLFLFSILRVVFYFYFRNPSDPVAFDTLAMSFYVGMKFDMRLAILGVLPLLLLGLFGGGRLLRSALGRFVITVYFVLVHLIAFTAYAFDFGHYAYLHERLNATALRFLYNLSISAEMIWQSYPVPIIGGGLLLFIVALWSSFAIYIKRVSAYTSPFSPGLFRRFAAVVLCTAIVLGGLYGKFSHYPLRWSDAFFDPHKFSSDLALNPLLYFAETYGVSDEPYDIEAARKYYPVMADYLGVDNPNQEKLDFMRSRTKVGPLTGTPNVVVVMLESFVFYKTGVFGNPLDPTPNFDAMADDGLLFKRFYTPSTGTARSVFALITGLPDVETKETSSRNPLIVKQRSIINAYAGYDKLYFLGGSVNWANIRGLLSHNIKDIEIYEEGSYPNSPRVDVWGISDLHLFDEANSVLAAKSEKPFFAIIQTSGNHRPYTIPEDSRGFEYRDEDETKVKNNGFYSTEEYNSYRFMDHSIGYFLREAAKHDYFDNTVFVFFGDHGLPGKSPFIPKSEQQLALTQFHVPLVIYAPGLIEGGYIYETIASELDIMPTIASLTSTPYLNTTQGRSLFDPAFDSERYAFTITGQSRSPEIGLISDRFYFKTMADGRQGDGILHDYYSDNPRDDVSSSHPEVTKRMREMLQAYYESARYIRYHNAQ